MAATTTTLLAALLSSMMGSEALHHVKDATAQQWSPLDAIRPHTDTKDASHAPGHANSKSDLQQIPRNVTNEGKNENENPPLMLVSGGCDGSGAILSHAQAILTSHGIENQNVLAEFLDPSGNDKAHLMVQRHKDLQQKNQTVLFKVTVGKDHKTITSERLYAEGAKVVVVTRANVIDQVVCLVKDCDGLGHPVIEGEESHLCKERRKKEPQNYKALVATNTLVSSIRKLDENVKKTTADLEGLGYVVETFNSEDLLDFEWNANKTDTAQKSWKRLLKAWGVSARQKTLAEYIEKGAGKREAPLPHTTTIYNFGSVKGAIKGDAKLMSMLRESASESESTQ